MDIGICIFFCFRYLECSPGSLEVHPQRSSASLADTPNTENKSKNTNTAVYLFSKFEKPELLTYVWIRFQRFYIYHKQVRMGLLVVSQQTLKFNPYRFKKLKVFGLTLQIDIGIWSVFQTRKGPPANGFSGPGEKSIYQNRLNKWNDIPLLLLEEGQKPWVT